MAQDTNRQREDQYQIPCHGIGKRQDDFGALLVEAVRATPKPASSMAHSTVTRALALWAHT